jgi:hypothetical protein
MSRGPGRIEESLRQLFIVTRGRALTVAELCDHVFGLVGAPASRSQRIATLRAAHRLIRRAAAARERRERAYVGAFVAATAALGRDPLPRTDPQFDAALWGNSELQRADLEVRRFGAVEIWRTTETDDGRLHFHPFDFPVHRLSAGGQTGRSRSRRGAPIRRGGG